MLIVVALLCFLLPGSGRRSTLAWALAWLLVGLAWVGWHAGERLQGVLPSPLEGRDLVVLGHLCEVPSRGSYGSVRFSLCVQHWESAPANTVGHQLPKRLKLAWYGKDAQLDLPQLMRVEVRLKRPHGSVNPAGFRYESWLFRNNYGATGTVQSVSAWEQGACGSGCRFHHWRKNLAQGLAVRLADIEHRALAEALLIGERGSMGPEHWRVFQATGTVHLVAISGLHIGLVAMGLGGLVGLLLRWLPQHRLAPSRRRALVLLVVILGSLAYALAAGFTVPTRRAWVMVVLASWLWFRAGRVGSGTGWLVALGLVLLLDPFSPLDRGFWLSFGAVAVLLLVFSGRLRQPPATTTLVLAQCAIFAGLWPMLTFMDQAPAAVGWLANLVAIPWLSFVVMPVLILGGVLLGLAPASGALVGSAYDAVLGLLWKWLALLAAWPVPELNVNPAVAIVIALLVLCLIMVPIPKARALACSLLVLWFAPVLVAKHGNAPTNTYAPDPELWVFDVGQGLSVLARHKDQVLLYDTGPEAPSGYSGVESVLLPTLKSLGITRIDTLILSHGDADHVGGLALLVESLAVGQVISGEPGRILDRLEPDVAAEQRGAQGPAPRIGACNAGQEITLGTGVVEFWQLPTSPEFIPSGNDASCVAILRFGSGSEAVEVILPGDISRRAEARMLATHSLHPVAYRILVASHHGSNTSSGRSWVNKLRPDVVVYTAGYRHRYGHPHPRVVSRFQDVGARAFNTAYSGAINWVFRASGPAIRQWRQDAPFWIRPAETVNPDT